ncbi:MAG: tyrosine-protein phosphatase [Cyclobacteriaceae bacterium]
MFSFFKKKVNPPEPLFTDIHSHLLAGLDDGVKSIEEALDLIRQFKDLGFRKAITTPHVMSDAYRNTPSHIKSGLEQLRKALAREAIDFEVEAAAEYYLDEVLCQKVKSNEPLLTFGGHYLLFETNFLTEPYQLKEFVFAVTTQGYKPILAHPERYQYLVNDFQKIEDLRNRNVLFQINIPSLVGAYSKPIQKLAQNLIDKGWVDFVGSDCHSQFHVDMMKEALKNKYFRKALELPLINREL